MTWRREPEFLTREILDAIHEYKIDTYGGRDGVRDENALESAISAAQNVYYYGGGDVYEVAAAYAYHIAESQAYLDGSKKAGAQAALVFMGLRRESGMYRHYRAYLARFSLSGTADLLTQLRHDG